MIFSDKVTAEALTPVMLQVQDRGMTTLTIILIWSKNPFIFREKGEKDKECQLRIQIT